MSEAFPPLAADRQAAVAPVAAPKPALSVLDAVMIIVGIVIGAGIFKTPSMVAGITGSVDWMLIAWVLGGVLSLIGALCYAELASAFPSAGGDYHFITRAYGRDASFFFAWARVTVITTGSVALLSFVFGDYMSRVVSLGPQSSAIYAALTVIVLTVVNIIGLRASARTQNVLTAIEVGGLLLVALAGLLAPPAATVAAPAAPAAGMPPLFGLAMVFVLLTYGGWNEAAYISAEVHGGPRAIVRALVLSLLIITVCYVAFVLAVLKGLGFAGMAKSSAVGADVMQAAFGPVGAQLIGAIVGVATLTSINATMIVGRADQLRARTRLADSRFHGLMARRAQRPRGRFPRAGGYRARAGGIRRAPEGRLQRHGRVHCTSFLVLLPADRHRAVRPAVSRTTHRTTVQGADVPDPADHLRPYLRVSAVLERDLRTVAERGSRGVLRDGRRCIGLGGHAPAGWPACATEMRQPDCSPLAGYALPTEHACACNGDTEGSRNAT